MNLLLLSDDASEKVQDASASHDHMPTDVVTAVTSHEQEIASSLTKQVSGDLLTTDADDDSIDDGLAQIHLQQIDKVPTDTPDSALSTSDTLSSYSGCSVGGVGEPFVAVFGGVQEVSQDAIGNEVDSSNDGDSAVLGCSVDGSLCGSVASSQDQGDECVPSINVTLSAVVDNTCTEKMESSSLSWYGMKIFCCFLYTYYVYLLKHLSTFGLSEEQSSRSTEIRNSNKIMH